MRSKEEIQELIHSGKHFCIYPWIHLHVRGLGMMAPCCISESKGYGNLHMHTLKQLWQGKEIRRFRLEMLKDQLEPGCRACYENEKSNGLSLRKQFNNTFEKYIDWVVNTDENGYSPDAKPIYWDVRFSNICNLRCRTCCSASSSSWYSDEKALGISKRMINIRTIVEKLGLFKPQKLLKGINSYYPYVERIYCAGGEPFLIEENLEMLKMLDSKKKYDTALIYNTNLTPINRGRQFMDYWKKFKNLTIQISLDGCYEKGEYIRKGIKWERIIYNLEVLKQECKHANLVVNFTVNIFNILHLPDFHKEIVEKKYLTAKQINLNILHSPQIFSIKILPKSLKKQATDKILAHISWLKGVLGHAGSINDNFIEQWYACLAHMNSEDWTHLIPEFIERTNKLDIIRKEKCLDVFPELEPVFLYSEKTKDASYN